MSVADLLAAVPEGTEELDVALLERHQLYPMQDVYKRQFNPCATRIMEPIYEGKAKRLYTTDNPNVLRMEYKRCV